MSIRPIHTVACALLAIAPLTAVHAHEPPTPSFGVAQLATGIRMHYAEQGDARGPAVILLHGYSDSWFSFSRILPKASSRVRMYALDLRGHGESDRPAQGYAMRDLAADVIAFMDAKGIQRATIVGHSMGSIVAQQVAIAAPARVQRLVLVGSGRSVRNMAGIGEFADVVGELADPVPARFLREFQESTIHAPVPPAFLDSVIDESRKLPARVWKELMVGMLAADPPTALADAGIPTLIVWGDHDQFFLRGEQEALLAMLPASRLVVFDETGHAVHWEKPEAFVQTLEAFLKS